MFSGQERGPTVPTDRSRPAVTFRRNEYRNVGRVCLVRETLTPNHTRNPTLVSVFRIPRTDYIFCGTGVKRKGHRVPLSFSRSNRRIRTDVYEWFRQLPFPPSLRTYGCPTESSSRRSPSTNPRPHVIRRSSDQSPVFLPRTPTIDTEVWGSLGPTQRDGVLQGYPLRNEGFREVPYGSNSHRFDDRSRYILL